MATTKITSPDLFNLESLNSALKLPSGTTAQRPTSPSTGEWRYNTTTNLVEFWDGGEWRDLQSEDIPPINSEHFNTVTWTGDGTASRAITGVGFQPDWIWYKTVSASNDHNAVDSTRGATNQLRPNTNSSGYNATDQILSFDSDGFTIGNGGDANSNGATYVAWCWKANGGTTSSNTDGTITSTVQANTKGGFSVVTYNGSGNADTVGHGLGAAPKVVIIKRTNGGAGFNWINGGAGLSWTSNETLSFDGNGDKDTWNYFNATAPTSTVFYLGTGANTGSVNDNAGTYIAYCFAEKAGYSKFDTYTGNGSENGPIVNTGFEPAFVIIKRSDSADNWSMTDNKRNTTNPRNKALFPNLSSSELTSGYTVDYLSNGFQIKSTDNAMNANGGTYIYYAFGSDASAAPTLENSFANKLYTGTGVSGLAVTGLGFGPSMVWIKNRDSVRDHNLADIIQGVSKEITPNTTEAQESRSVTSFDSDGFTLDNASGNYNANGENYVAWNWKANPIPTINNDGTIQSLVSANQAAGLSIVKWTTNGSASQTVGHGLSVAPSIIIYKRLDGAQDWFFETDIVDGSYDYLNLNTSGASQDGGAAWSTRSTSTTISAFTSSNNFDYIAYCFTSISGFSKMGSYTGNGSSTGPVVPTGFEPSFVMIKEASQANDWNIYDNKRTTTNPRDVQLQANSNAAESTNSSLEIDFLSDSFQPKGTGGGSNRNGSTYIYMAYKANLAQYPIPSGQMGYLVAAGGGSGFYSTGAGGVGGGGAGGFRTTYGLTSGGGASAETNLTLATGTYTVTIGAGGAMTSGAGNDGNDSSITGLVTITTTGGGAGGGGNAVGSAGGSGGGAGELNSGTSLAGGAGTANQGFAGGTSVVNFNGAGGGGASSVGANNGANLAGNGGAGITSAITGSNVGYAGGGGGAAYQSSSTGGNGTYGGGDGTLNGIRTASTAGGINTGGGGGALGGSIGAGGYTTGGSGIVVLRMNTSDFSGATSGSPTISAIGSETILQYLASGSYTHNPSTAAGTMNYMVLAGGASGASNGGGGGAGGLRSSWYASGGGAGGETPLTLSSGTYTITIGAGGAEVTTYQDPGNDGTATTISGNATVNTVGGGGGGSNNTNAGRNGGSGGGAGAHPGAAYNGGSGTAGEGFDGGRAGAVNQPYTGAGGGGTGAVGEPNSASAAGAGGNGLALGITGALVNYGGGGGGSGGTPTGGLSGGAGGAGGGGAGGAYNSTGIAGTVNTGGGGGGSGDNVGVGGAGGSGKVILRLITSEYSGTTTGSPTVTTVGTETVLTFTGSGTYVHS